MATRPYLREKSSTSLGGAGHSQQSFVIICFVSLLAHGLFFVGILMVQGFEMSRPLPRVLQVDLVSFVPGPVGGKGDASAIPDLPTKSAPPEEAKSVPEPVEAEQAEVSVEKTPVPEPVKPEPDPVAEIKPDISLKAKPKNLKELMAEPEEKKKPEEKPEEKKSEKPKVDPEEALKKAREKIAKKLAAQDQSQKQISDALDRMKAAVATQGKNSEETAINQGDTQGEGTGPGAGTGTGEGQQGYEPIDLYKMLLQSAIEQNWVFNDMMAGMDQTLECRILIKILRNGQIRDIDYETRSGNRYLDESAKKAITRANPLPQLPKGMNSYDVVVIFTPKGLK